MLKELVEQGFCSFIDHAQSWQDAIRISCRPLIEKGIVEESYADELIDNVNEYGPYIVLMPGFAMPHTMQGAKGAKGTGMSFLKVKEPVVFDPSDRDKDAVVFFTLAATDSDAHIENIRRLCNLISDENFFSALLNATCPQDLLAIDEKYRAINIENNE
jgi:PTS system ascorbate-specific IIA component